MRLPVVTAQAGGRDETGFGDSRQLGTRGGSRRGVGLSYAGSTSRSEGPRMGERLSGRSQLHDGGRLMVPVPLTGEEMDELGW
jgi:hypothetical protein